MYLEVLRQAYKKDGSLHHACLIQGDRESVLNPLISFLEKDMKFKTLNNPDFQVLEFDSFGVSDGRLLQGRAAQKALKERKIFVATFNVMTLEAQNSLLKLFEEPTSDTHFFLITPNIDKLLHTLRSRMIVFEETSIIEGDISKKANLFLKSSQSERLILVKDIIEKKDKAVGASFLGGLEEKLHTKLHGKDCKSIAIGLRDVTDAKSFIGDRGSSMKLLLEHLALTLPKVQ